MLSIEFYQDSLIFISELITCVAQCNEYAVCWLVKQRAINWQYYFVCVSREKLVLLDEFLITFWVS